MVNVVDGMVVLVFVNAIRCPAFPTGIAPKGWREQHIAEYNPDNLYVKIDGREGYYKALGFKKLHCVTLVWPAVVIVNDTGAPPATICSLMSRGTSASVIVAVPV